MCIKYITKFKYNRSYKPKFKHLHLSSNKITLRNKGIFEYIRDSNYSYSIKDEHGLFGQCISMEYNSTVRAPLMIHAINTHTMKGFHV